MPRVPTFITTKFSLTRERIMTCYQEPSRVYLAFFNTSKRNVMIYPGPNELGIVILTAGSILEYERTIPCNMFYASVDDEQGEIVVREGFVDPIYDQLLKVE